MATIKYEKDSSLTTLLSTELNSLASGSGSSLGTEFDNSTGLWLWGDFEAVLDFASSPTAGQVVELYLVPAPDGTNYADGSSTVFPANSLVGAFVSRAVSTAQRIVLRGVQLPPTKFKVLAVNRTSQALDSSGNTVKLLPYRLQSS